MLPASRWFVLIAAIAVLAMIGLALIAHHLEGTIPAGSVQGLRLAAFVHAADIGLLLLFGFAMVPPMVREATRLLARCLRLSGCERAKRAAIRRADLVAVGVWALCAAGIVIASPSFSELMPISALLSQP
jgi:hypothetical protein